MIRTFITPTESSYSIVLEFPDDYLGEELELIVFKKQEGLSVEKATSNNSLSAKYKGVFTKADAKSFNEHIQIMRNEWETI